MPQIAPVDVEAAMVKCMNHLVHNRVLHMLLAEESVLTQKNSMFWMKPPRSGGWTGMALNRCGRKWASRQSQVFRHEDYSGTWKFRMTMAMKTSDVYQ